ncbi:hypothetical protein V0288_22450 [Pannus brasiliensis CCIBt3594]|uniref:Uncharacterized protein n=1 Tax=Pannus brasiliensis CCIBt3594 TaxID=1427578 RepID=A0AAW9QQ55_9CHRO
MRRFKRLFVSFLLSALLFSSFSFRVSAFVPSPSLDTVSAKMSQSPAFAREMIRSFGSQLSANRAPIIGITAGGGSIAWWQFNQNSVARLQEVIRNTSEYPYTIVAERPGYSSIELLVRYAKLNGNTLDTLQYPYTEITPYLGVSSYRVISPISYSSQSFENLNPSLYQDAISSSILIAPAAPPVEAPDTIPDGVPVVSPDEGDNNIVPFVRPSPSPSPSPDESPSPSPSPVIPSPSPTGSPGDDDDSVIPTPTPTSTSTPGEPTPTPTSTSTPGEPTPTPTSTSTPVFPTPTPIAKKGIVRT